MPELFHWGPIKLHTYGFMWAVGIWLAVWRALRAAPRYNIKSDDVFDLAFLTIVAGVIGGDWVCADFLAFLCLGSALDSACMGRGDVLFWWVRAGDSGGLVVFETA